MISEQLEQRLRTGARYGLAGAIHDGRHASGRGAGMITSSTTRIAGGRAYRVEVPCDADVVTGVKQLVRILKGLTVRCVVPHLYSSLGPCDQARCQ